MEQNKQCDNQKIKTDKCPKERNNSMKNAYFRIDKSPNFYEGIDTENLWNGWAMPLFSKQVADLIIKKACEDESVRYIYEAQKDEYVYWCKDDPDEKEIFKGKDYTVDGEIKHLYDIGSGYWVWDSYSQEEINDIINENNIPDIKVFVNDSGFLKELIRYYDDKNEPDICD